MNAADLPLSVRWDGATLHLLDQRRLPDTVQVDPYVGMEEVFRAITELRVRGAPAIGIAAGYGLVLGMAPHRTADAGTFRAKLSDAAGYLRSARPTAVNLAWAVERVAAAGADALAAHDAEAAWQAMREAAVALHEDDRRLCRAIGEHGVALLGPGAGILTYCNAGALAVSELGTASAPMYLAHAAGLRPRIVVCETRPLLQGARLTAWELGRRGLDVTLICDNMAAHVMASGAIDLVLVGTDRVTRNGDVVNKIGTSALAILARYFGIPFYVACPSSTFDPGTATGDAVPIEERGAEEVSGYATLRTAPAGIKVRNPAFDVTPAELVTALITDRGVIRPPYAETLRVLLR